MFLETQKSPKNQHFICKKPENFI